MDIDKQASFLKLAYLLDAVTLGDIMKWVDWQIAEIPRPPDWLLDLSLHLPHLEPTRIEDVKNAFPQPIPVDMKEQLAVVICSYRAGRIAVGQMLDAASFVLQLNTLWRPPPCAPLSVGYTNDMVKLAFLQTKTAQATPECPTACLPKYFEPLASLLAEWHLDNVNQRISEDLRSRVDREARGLLCDEPFEESLRNLT